MNYVAIDIYDQMVLHSGVKHRSGRYKFGTGEIPYQHEPWFTWGKNDWLNKYRDLEGKGYSQTEIAKELGMSTTECRTRYKNAINEERIQMISANDSLREAGYNRSERARMMGMNESSLRSLENTISKERTERAQNTADFLKSQIDKKGPIDISTGVEILMGISKDKLRQAVKILEDEGYEKYTGRNEQVTNEGKFTTTTVLCPPGTGKANAEGKLKSNIVYHPDKINLIDIPGVNQVDGTSYDNGKTFKPAFQYPASMDSKRIFIRYGDEGGVERDGTIEIRPGVPDLNLGEAHYSQVRILVDDNKYMKGMAHYMDAQTAIDIPKQYDLIYNSRKTRAEANKVFKDITKDPNNPFGSLIKEKGGQSEYIDPNTGEKKLSLINKRADEGDWNEWSDRLPSQFLSKQPVPLIKKQLNLTIADKRDELDEIKSLENPTIKKQLLIDFAQSADKAAVHLYAAALPRQKYKVILPVTSLSDNECYCPELETGTTVALIRFPHAGTFEIPILKVNNNNVEAKQKLGTSAIDGIGINAHIAQQLSGADFDGDTVLIIPNADKQHIKSTKPLKGLENFDPEERYGYGDTPDVKMKIMTEGHKQIQMGIVSNLITDMTIKGANPDEMAAAVRHSMVVIDAVKHKLDYTRSAQENQIDILKKKYQGHYDLDGQWKKTGASTIISRAKNEWDVPKTQGDPKIDPDTGELIWKHKEDSFFIDKKTGKPVYITKKSTQMAETKDAFTLISDTRNPVEIAYAEFANSLKAMANEARKESLSTGNLVYNKEAALRYSDATDSLKHKILIAQSNAPLERAAQRKATYTKKQAEIIDNSLTEKDLSKIAQQALIAARLEYGAQRYPIDISDREWEAIQAGAISDNMLRTILKYADSDKLKQRAMPRASIDISDAKIQRIRSMEASGYTIAQIANRLDISPTTVKKYLNVNTKKEGS